MKNWPLKNRKLQSDKLFVFSFHFCKTSVIFLKSDIKYIMVDPKLDKTKVGIRSQIRFDFLPPCVFFTFEMRS